MPDPEPGPGEVLVEVAATAVNRADVMQRQGHYPPPPGASPYLGLECSGRSAALGDEVAGWNVGDEVCALLREWDRPARILMLTAAAGIDDLVSGLDLGADDYLAKPFDFTELMARIRALGRRSTPAVAPVLRFADVELDPSKMAVTRGGAPIALTPREHAVLEILLRAGGGIVSSEELLEKAWDEHADPLTTSVRVIVSRLRTKLGDPPLIETLVTKGYRMREPSG